MKERFFSYWSKMQNSGRATELGSFEEKAEEFALLMRLCGYRDSLSVVDWGCGAGEILSFLAQKVRVVRAVDVSPRLLEKARENVGHGVEFEVGDAIEKCREALEDVWISAEAVGQYGDRASQEMLVEAFSRNEKARMLFMFDNLEPMKYRLWQGRLVRYKEDDRTNMEILRRGYRMMQCVAQALRPRRSVYLGESMGYAHPVSLYLSLAERYGLQCRIVSSWFSEYRYHVALMKG